MPDNAKQPVSGSTQLPGWAINLIIVIAAIAVTLIIVESVLRFIPSVPAGFTKARLIENFHRIAKAHPVWGWGFAPNAHVVLDYTGREKHKVMIDWTTIPIPNYPEYGMRDDGVNPDADQVVVVLGDSFTFGATAQLRDIWCEQIELRNPAVDMINLAQGGGVAKAAAEYGILKDVLPHHDLVIYEMWLGNEFFDNWAWRHIADKPDFMQNLHRIKLHNWLAARSKVFFLLLDSYREMKTALLGSNYPSMEYEHEPDGVLREGFGRFYVNPRNPVMTRYCEKEYSDKIILEGIEETERGLSRLKALAGKKLVVMLFPFRHQVHRKVIHDLIQQHQWDMEKPDRVVLKMCRKLDIPCFDILEGLRKHEDKNLFWEYDEHFSPLGHHYASLEVERILKENKLLRFRPRAPEKWGHRIRPQ